jgi:hypothetical protein
MNNNEVQGGDPAGPHRIQLRVPVNIIIRRPSASLAPYPIGIGAGPAPDPTERLAGKYIMEKGKKVRRSQRLIDRKSP